MKPRVYIETSIVSYLTSRKSRNVIVAGQQEATRQWWQDAPDRFELVTSQLALDEASQGDSAAAKRRLKSLEGLPLLELNSSAVALAGMLMEMEILPRKASDDAFHLSIVTEHRSQFLLTWNCRHLANALIRRRIEEVCRATGRQAPVICTPHELAREV